jgi:uncharacterized protein YfaS (alpha-2-macroglobulin family)
MQHVAVSPLRVRALPCPVASFAYASRAALPPAPHTPGRLLARLLWLAVLLLPGILLAAPAPATTTPAPTTPTLDLRVEYLHVYQYGQERDGISVRFELNAALDRAELLKHLEITPAVTNLRLDPRGSDGYALYADWRGNTSYTMIFTPGLRDRAGKILRVPLTQSIKIDEIPPYLGFADADKYYLPRKGRLSPVVETRNFSHVTLRLQRLFPNNLSVVINGMENRGHRWYGEDDSEADVDLPVETMANLSQHITSFTVPLAARPDKLLQTPVALDKQLKSLKGVYLLEASASKSGNADDEEGVRSAQRVVLMTNLGVLAHWQDDGGVVFVHDLLTLKPFDNAKVRVYSTKNQLLGTAETNRHGVAWLSKFDPTLGTPSVLVAEYKDEYTFLKLTPRPEDDKQLGAASEPYRSDRYQAFLYADRELYRPGETAHLRWSVRQASGGAVGTLPLTLTILKPNGKALLTEPIALTDLGTGGYDLVSQQSYPTGAYTAQLTVPGSGEPIGTYSFSLEEFVPSRIKGEIKMTGSSWQANQRSEFTVNAQHLFGAPAANLDVKAYLQMTKEPVTFKDFADYHFSNDDAWEPDGTSLGSIKTDAKGIAAFAHTLQLPAEATQPLRGKLSVRVYEPGGRPIQCQASLNLFPAATLLGIAARPLTGGGITVAAAAVTTQGQPAVLDKIKFTLEKQVWNYNVRRYYSHYESNWTPTYEEMSSQEVGLTRGRADVNFNPGGWGYYRVRLSAAGTSQYSTATFYCYGGKCEVADPTRPTLIKLSLDKEHYAIGDKARLRIESPYNGRAVVVLQGAKWFDVQSLEIKNNLADLIIPVRAEYFPNFWAEVTVIHEVNAGNVALNPFSSFAAIPLRVDDPQRAITITLPGLPQEWTPAEPVNVAIELRDERGKPIQGEVTLAAVDEGIHLITEYTNPDPLGWLTRLRKPLVRRNHYYDRISYDFDKPATGGDGDDMNDRTQAPGESWIKPVALWSGAVRVDKHGRAVVPLTLPEFTGQLRLVAVATASQRLGVGAAQIFVRRPWLMRASVPRFALPGDQFRAHMSLFNQSKAAVHVRLTALASGAASIPALERELDLAPSASTDLTTTVTIAPRLGQAELRWDATILDSSGKELAQLREALPIPVRAPAAYQTIPAFNIIEPGHSQTFTTDPMLPDDRTLLRIDASVQPLKRLQQALGYVVGYPYGCVEQTTSKLMPLYLLRKQALALTVCGTDGTTVTREQLNVMIQAGINRLFSMQTPQGGLAYWPGGQEAYYYGSIYALHCLTLIEQGREFTLPAENMANLRKYIRSGALNAGIPDNYAQTQRAYALFVLTLGGDAQAAAEIERLDQVPLTRSARLLLAAALAHATHDAERVRHYLKTAPVKPYTYDYADPIVNSPWRDKALELLALQATGEDETAVSKSALELTDWLSKHFYGNTHESSLIITALAGYLDRHDLKLDQAHARITTPSSGTLELTPTADFVTRHRGPAARYVVNNDGKVPLFVNTWVSGVPREATGAATTCTALTIKRRIYTLDGKLTTATQLLQMTTYVVDLELQPSTSLSRVVVADLLPAGFEIDNPRLNGTGISAASFREAVQPDYTDLRDDRLILAFDSLSMGVWHYYYVVQTVTPGKFAYPAAIAECMYDLNTKAATASGNIVIQPVK